MAEATPQASPSIVEELAQRFPGLGFEVEPTKDDVPTLWLQQDALPNVLRYLKWDSPQAFRMLFDLTAIDERLRRTRQKQAMGSFTLIYHLSSFQTNRDLRIKVALEGERPITRTITDIWPAANWYEREVWDMFGITFEGHPNLRRLLMPPGWIGHPLRKDHFARATEQGMFELTDSREEEEQEELQFRPEEWGLQRSGEDTDFMFLNLGPHHPGTHGPIRFVAQLDGETLLDVVPDIGYHHRAAEKMGERQSWHTFIPYTDRIDYLGGVMNNFPYVMAVEMLAGIEVPDRVKVTRIMLAELYRIYSHLVWFGTFASDIGAMSPVFYMFTDREHLLRIIEAVCGFRMHPSWFRIGGVAADLPNGWEELVRGFLDSMEGHINEYRKLVVKNAIFKRRTQGISPLSTEDAIEWGATGPMLRATGFAWDYRKMRPYSAYEQFEFEVPTGANGDCYDRTVVRTEEIQQSLRIVRQCLENMPAGPYKADHPLTTPPIKEKTMHDIETLIHHFLSVSWGPVIPAGEAAVAVEGTKGIYSYYLVSDEDTISYRTRIRTASFPHIQLMPVVSRGFLLSDFVAVFGSFDYVMGDVDR